MSESSEVSIDSLLHQAMRITVVTMVMVVVTVMLLASTVFAVLHSGKQSMLAFEGLPRYRVNLLLKDYREAVTAMDASMQSTTALVASDGARQVIDDADDVIAIAIDSERGFREILQDYEAAYLDFADQLGGTAEWRRYFGRDLAELVAGSEARERTLSQWQARFPQFQKSPE